jgi:hypothetical protein
MYYRANIYILGLIEFDREEVVLKRDQLNQIEKRICEIVSDLEGEKKDEKKYLPYRVWSLPESVIFDKNTKFINTNMLNARTDNERDSRSKNENPKKQSNVSMEHEESSICQDKPIIVQVNLGYYHHRIILSISAEFTKNSFENLREMRDIFHKFFRDNIVNGLLSLRIARCEGTGPECTIVFIYSYPFFVVENGDEFMEHGHNYADTIYSDATTAFLFKIPESSIIPKNHFVRVSIPFTLLYSSGDVEKDLFWNIINAIYFGGLYKKKSQDRKKGTNERINEFNELILVDLSRLMLENISQVQFSVINMKMGWIAIFFALVAIVISIFK